MKRLFLTALMAISFAAPAMAGNYWAAVLKSELRGQPAFQVISFFPDDGAGPPSLGKKGDKFLTPVLFRDKSQDEMEAMRGAVLDLSGDAVRLAAPDAKYHPFVGLEKNPAIKVPAPVKVEEVEVPLER